MGTRVRELFAKSLPSKNRSSDGDGGGSDVRYIAAAAKRNGSSNCRVEGEYSVRDTHRAKRGLYSYLPRGRTFLVDVTPPPLQNSAPPRARISPPLLYHTSSAECISALYTELHALRFAIFAAQLHSGAGCGATGAIH